MQKFYRKRMQLSSGNRLRSFDILKLFAIFLVLWGHCIQYFLSSEPVDEPLYRTIYAFHMPLFMMISGYFAASSMHIRLNDFLKKKSVQLLLPCLTWGILISFLIRPALDSSFIDSLLHSFRGGFWFLKSCFICYLIAFLGYRCNLKRGTRIVLTLFFSQVIPFYQVHLMYPAFLLGLELNNSPEMMRKLKSVYPLIVLSFIVLLCSWDKSFWFSPDLKESIINRDPYPPLEYGYKRTYRIIIGIAGSLSFFFLFQKLFDKDSIPKFFEICSSWGQYTLGIYILQSYIIEVLLARYLNFDHLNFYLFNFIVAPSISIIILIVCVFIIKVIHKSPVCAFWLLGKFPRRTNHCPNK